MPDIIQQGISNYPGIPGFESVTYSTQHGKTPGQVIASTRFPPIGAPAIGDFTMTDGSKTIVLRDCKCQRVETEIGDGRTWTYYFLDRAWRWAFGKISGHYNQRDTRGNLKPRTVKSFTQMAKILLKAMGETRYDIDFPKGVEQDQLDLTNDNPAPGDKTPDTNTNPEVVWDHVTMIDALLALCDLAGRRFMRCPIRDIIVIKRPGDGAALPYNDCFIDVGDGLEGTATPDGLGIVGAAAMFQMRLRLIPVALEWDGRYVPIEEVSYRPNRTPQAGQWTLTVTASAAGPYTLVPVIDGVSFGALVESTPNALAVRLAGLINATAPMSEKVTAEVSGVGNAVTITGKKPGLTVSIEGGIDGDNATMVVATVRRATKSCWDGEVFGQWGGVQATDRLSYEQARQHAVESVGVCFRVADDDVSNGWGDVPGGGAPKKIFVPLVGEINHRDQLVLLTEKVDQVKPEAVDPDVLNAGGAEVGLPAAQFDAYLGFSRGQSPVVYGSISNLCQGRWWHKDGRQNTPPGSRVAVPWVLDPVAQIVTFTAGPVYKEVITGPSGRDPGQTFPNLVLETAVNVLENDTYGMLRYLRWINFGKPDKGSENRDRDIEVDLSKYGIKDTPIQKVKLPRRQENIGTNDKPKPGVEWHHHEADVVYAAAGDYVYDADLDRHRLAGSHPDPGDDSAKRADYYLLGHILEHQLQDAQTARYRGIELIPLDGAVQHVTWTVDRGGVLTTASRNSTHGVNVMPYPLRRREENLAADPTRAAANRASQARYEAVAGIVGAAQKAVNFVTRLFRG